MTFWHLSASNGVKFIISWITFLLPATFYWQKACIFTLFLFGCCSLYWLISSWNLVDALPCQSCLELSELCQWVFIQVKTLSIHYSSYSFHLLSLLLLKFILLKYQASQILQISSSIGLSFTISIPRNPGFFVEDGI